MPAPLDVLIVDDQPKIGQLLEQVLTVRNCTVRLACDGLDGLSQFQKQPADLIITDIQMPKLSGIELLRELKRLDPLVNVVVITAFPSIDGAVEAMRCGACDFITKPFDVNQIQAILYRCQQRVLLSRQLKAAGEGTVKLEELNRRLAELNDLKSQFLAALSHEINTPLCLMSEWIYLLSEGTLGKLSSDQERAVDVLIGAYERLHLLMQQLIDLMHGHEIVLNRQASSLQELIQQAVSFESPKAHTRSIAVVLTMPQAPLMLEVDRNRFLAAFQYLINNAIKFNHDQGRVEIVASVEPDLVKIQISDTGIGIPMEEQERVFAPFYQVDRSLNRAHEGAGIGLTLAKRYVELHGGSLHLNSTIGTGTTVTITLPTPAASVTRPALREVPVL